MQVALFGLTKPGILLIKINSHNYISLEIVKHFLVL